MTKAKISEYDAVAANNTDVNGVNIAEGCPPSGMNNMGREIMAALKRFQTGSDSDGVTVGGNLVVSGSSTLSTTSISSADINAGTIDGTAIGGSTAAAGSFTTLTATSDATINGLTVGEGAGSISTNTAVGASALAANTTGCNNTAIGTSALLCNTTASSNTAMGFEALCANTTGCLNTAVGLCPLRANTTGFSNAATGASALLANTTGDNNTAVGQNALLSNTTGSFNTAYGSSALRCLTTGSNNIGIGLNAGRTGCSPLVITTASNQVVIGNNSHDCFVARCAWVTSSDCRDKTDVAPTVYGLNFVRALQPVEYKWDSRYRYGYDEATGQYGTPDGSKKDSHCSIGFLAQQVIALEKEIAPDRKPIIVSEDDPNSLLLAETRIIPALVKAIQELAARVEQLENA